MSRGVAAGGARRAPVPGGFVAVVGGRTSTVVSRFAARRLARLVARERAVARAALRSRASRSGVSGPQPTTSAASTDQGRAKPRNSAVHCSLLLVLGTCRSAARLVPSSAHSARAIAGWHTSCCVFRQVRNQSSQIVRDLARRQGESLVSCYVPFARTGKDVRQNGIQLKNCQRTIAQRANATPSTSARRLPRRASSRAPRSTAQESRAPRGRARLVRLAGRVRDARVPAAVLVPLVTIAPAVLHRAARAVARRRCPPVLVLALSRHAVRLIEPRDGARARRCRPTSRAR